MTTRVRIVFAAAALAIPYFPDAAEQPPAGTKKQSVFEQYRPVGAACKKDDSAASSAPPPVPEVRPDYACAVSPEALRRATQPDGVILDLRSGTDFAAFHLQGAINVTPADLHGKPYWRNKEVTLVGSGKAERELYTECTRLKRLGYRKVGVLRGGIPAGLASEMPVVGTAPSHAQMAYLSPSEFLLESANPGNLVILGKGRGELQNHISFAAVVPEETAAAVAGEISARRRALKHAALESVVLVPDSRTPEQYVEEVRRRVHPVPVLVYAGSPDAFLKQKNVQEALWAAHARGPRKPACG